MKELDFGARSVVQAGPSLTINLPKQFTRLHKLRKGERLNVTMRGKKFEELVLSID